MFDAPVIDLAHQCAPAVPAEMIIAVARVESGLNPFAIRVNSGRAPKRMPTSKEEAIETATALMVEGQDLDIGLGGLPAAELGRLGLTLTEAFDPCKNMAAVSQRLELPLKMALKAGLSEENARRRAFASAYGSGDTEQGFMAGYDVRVMAELKAIQPKLGALKLVMSADPILPSREGSGTVAAAAPATATAIREAQDASAPSPSQPSASHRMAQAQSSQEPEKGQQNWDVFGASQSSSVFVFHAQ